MSTKKPLFHYFSVLPILRIKSLCSAPLNVRLLANIPPYRVEFSCNTPSIPAKFALSDEKFA